MKTFRHSAPVRALLVALTLAAWLVATNHCAFGLMRGPAAPHAPCHGGKSSEGKSAPECCRALHGLPVSERITAPASEAPPAVPIFVRLRLLAPVPAVQVSSGFFTHGPPGESFAEAVLQQSLLSHAPPAVA